MSKKGKDLYELLQLRHRQAPGRKVVSRPRRPDEPGAWYEQVAGWLRQLTAGARVRQPQAGRGKSSGKARPGVRLSGLGLIAVIGSSLTVGFVGGRWIAPSRVAQGLRTSVGPPRTERPQWVPDARERAGETKILSNMLFVVLHFASSQRARASELAFYLREHGLATARIRRFDLKTPPNRSRWATIVYVMQKDQAPDVLKKLKKVPPPPFEPMFVKAVSALTMDHLNQME